MLSGRRVTFSLLILASQLLFIALAIAWLIQMLMIAMNGSIQFVENNRTILIAEIVITGMITVFAIGVFLVQIKRLGEKRRGEK